MGGRDEEDEARSVTGLANFLEGIDQLETFLEENRSSITIMGVFIAVAEYLRNAELPATASNTIPYRNIIAAAAFSIVILLGLIICIRLVQRVLNTSEGLVSIIDIPVILFSIFFFIIYISIFSYAISFSRVWVQFSILFSYVFSFITYMVYIEKILDSGLKPDDSLGVFQLNILNSNSRNNGRIVVLGTTIAVSGIVLVVVQYLVIDGFRILYIGQQVSGLPILAVWVYIFSTIWFLLSTLTMIIVILD